MNFTITSDHGRIGPFWWFNSDTSLRTYTMALFQVGLLYTRWGTCGIGGTPMIRYTGNTLYWDHPAFDHA
jgi:hypothetical protein